jgi:hypothetical protein
LNFNNGGLVSEFNKPIVDMAKPTITEKLNKWDSIKDIIMSA